MEATDIVVIRGRCYARLAFTATDEERRCPECEAEPGRLHEQGCGLELCPNCSQSLVECDCDPEGDEEEFLTSAKGGGV